MSASPRLTANFKELQEYGKSPGREMRALEQHAKEAFKSVEGFVNNVLVRAVMAIGNRSMFTVQPVKSESFQAVGGLAVVPINMVDTTAPVTVTLPRRQANLVCIVKDAIGNASAQTITVQPYEDLANIDGSPTPDTIVTDFACVWYVCDNEGTDWLKVVP